MWKNTIPLTAPLIHIFAKIKVLNSNWALIQSLKIIVCLSYKFSENFKIFFTMVQCPPPKTFAKICSVSSNYILQDMRIFSRISWIRKTINLYLKKCLLETRPDSAWLYSFVIMAPKIRSLLLALGGGAIPHRTPPAI